MPKASFTLTNKQQFMSQGAVQEKRLDRAAGSSLLEEGESIMTDSKENYVPVDQGQLRSSGHVQGPDREGGSIFVILGYGGAAEPYALIQHESLHFQHRVGQAKFLEKPVLAAESGMGRRVGDRIKRKMR